MIPCEIHHVVITDRGGRRAIAELDSVSAVRWSRIRDDMSKGLVRISTGGAKCCDILGDLRTGRHEMVIYRGDDRVWEGPITRLAYRPGEVEIDARDVMFYPYRTIARAAYNNAHPNVTTVTERMRTMLTNELSRKERLDPPINVLPYLDIRTDSQTARTARNTKPYQMTVWEDIDSMAARAGLDYTVIGRRILGWDVHHSIGQTATLTEQDFLDEVIVTEYGMELATYSAVTDSEGNWGAVGIGQPGSESIDPYYGEWELLNTSYAEDVSDTSTPTTKPSTAELRSQAARNLAGRHPAPVVVRVPDNASLDPRSTALSISDLCPGVWVPLRSTATCRPVTQMQKLDRLAVEENSQGETISVSLSTAPGPLSGISTLGSDDG